MNKCISGMAVFILIFLSFIFSAMAEINKPEETVQNYIDVDLQSKSFIFKESPTP